MSEATRRSGSNRSRGSCGRGRAPCTSSATSDCTARVPHPGTWWEITITTTTRTPLAHFHSPTPLHSPQTTTHALSQTDTYTHTTTLPPYRTHTPLHSYPSTVTHPHTNRHTTQPHTQTQTPPFSLLFRTHPTLSFLPGDIVLFRIPPSLLSVISTFANIRGFIVRA